MPVAAQTKIAVITPEKNGRSLAFAAKIENEFAGKFKVLDSSLSDIAFSSGAFEKPFNLTVEQAQNAGAAIGANYFLLVKSELQRRSAFGREEYYEAYSIIYLVSAKSGKLIFWTVESRDANLPSEAETKLYDSVKGIAADIAGKIKESEKDKTESVGENPVEEIPAENSPEAKNFRPPLPYKRISPAYTKLADLYNVEATVDVAVEVGADGKILKTEIVRWAGYGLDESVIEAVTKMNWRPAERNRKPLPMRILLRYNFKDIADEES